LLIADDLKGRKFANQPGIKITGTFGIIVDAKLTGKIPSEKPIIAKIKQPDFRISDKIEIVILAKAQE
jgi:predicted nucleic acid-binding protein